MLDGIPIASSNMLLICILYPDILRCTALSSNPSLRLGQQTKICSMPTTTIANVTLVTCINSLYLWGHDLKPHGSLCIPIALNLNHGWFAMQFTQSGLTSAKATKSENGTTFINCVTPIQPAARTPKPLALLGKRFGYSTCPRSCCCPHCSLEGTTHSPQGELWRTDKSRWELQHRRPSEARFDPLGANGKQTKSWNETKKIRTRNSRIK